MSATSRRHFLMGVAGTALLPATARCGGVRGANETIRIAVCGVNGQGKGHIEQYNGLKGVQITILVDPDRRLWASRSEMVRTATGVTPKCVADVRQALDDKNIDAISIATPNHWHSLMTIWACQAGKDVYVEKPLSHNMTEGRRAVEAARKYNRIVQHGTQNRSSQSRANEIAAVHSGKYGKLLVSKGYCCKPRWSIGRKDPTAAPSELDFNLWLGPAQETPYHENLVHYNWHWFWDFGNGDIGNQGIHELDVARWAIKDATLPTKVWSLGGRFAEGDQGQTPNMQLAVFEFGDTLLVFETRGLVDRPKDSPWKFKVGNEYYTSEGMIANGKFHPKGGSAPEPLGQFDVKVAPGGAFGSFVNAVRSQNVSDCNADVELGHHSCALIHGANASYRLGKDLPFQEKSQKIGDNERVVESFRNIQENLTGVGIKLEEHQYRLGRTLTLDPKTERYVDDGAKKANEYVTREYRAPFIVPSKL